MVDINDGFDFLLTSRYQFFHWLGCCLYQGVTLLRMTETVGLLQIQRVEMWRQPTLSQMIKLSTTWSFLSTQMWHATSLSCILLKRRWIMEWWCKYAAPHPYYAAIASYLRDCVFQLLQLQSSRRQHEFGDLHIQEGSQSALLSIYSHHQTLRLSRGKGFYFQFCRQWFCSSCSVWGVEMRVRY